MAPSEVQEDTPRVTCVGAVVIDRRFDLLAPVVPGTSNPARSRLAGGGVARNVAETLVRLGLRVTLVSRVGADVAGRELRRQLADLGVGVDGISEVAGSTTAEYVAVLDPSGELVLGIASMDVMSRIGAEDVERALPPSGWLFLDTNLGPEVLARGIAVAAGRGVSLAVDAVSTAKVTRLPADLGGIALLVANRDEAVAWLAAHGHDPGGSDVERATRLHDAGAVAVVLASGAAGAVAADAGGARRVAAVPARVVDVTGAGDALAGGVLAGLASGLDLDAALALGVQVAAAAVSSPEAVSAAITPAMLDAVADRRRGAAGA